MAGEFGRSCPLAAEAWMFKNVAVWQRSSFSTPAGSAVAGLGRRWQLVAACMSTGAASAMAELDASAIGALAELVAGPASIPAFGLVAAPAAEPGLQSSPEFTST